MHKLRLYMLPMNDDGTFDVRWTNTEMRPRGVVRVKISTPIGDRPIVAELAALKYLLEEKAALGHNRAGSNDVELVVSHGAIRRLHRCQSDKEHLAPYANFLTTRFLSCRVRVDKDTRWFEGIPPETIELLPIAGPQRETLNFTGLGKVAISRHVIGRFSDRFLTHLPLSEAPQTAWRKLLKLCSDKTVREVSRKSLWAGVNAANQGWQEGRYFLNPNHDLVFVVANDPRGARQLVTVYRANHQFHELRKAA